MATAVLDIGVLGPSYPDAFADNIAAGVRALGHRSTLLGPARPALARGYRAASILGEVAFKSVAVDERVQRRSLDQRLDGRRFDLVIVVDGTLLPSMVDHVRRHAGFVVFWFPDPVANLGRQSMIQARYDGVFTKEPVFARQAAEYAGTAAHLLHEACHPEWHRPVGKGRDPHIVVMGNYYPYRVRLLERLHRAGIPLRLYGNPFPRWLASNELAPLHTGRYVACLDKAEVMRSAVAVLNVMNPTEIEGLNCRLFEGTGSGAAVLSEFRPLLSTCFKIDDEVLAFETFDDLVDRARWCLDHPDEARAIGDRAAVRAHAEHTYAHRLRTILATVGLGSHLGEDG